MKKGRYLDLLMLLTSNKLRFILYLVAAGFLLIPLAIVSVTDIPFNSFYSGIFINTALICVILGRISAVARKTMEDKVIQWWSIGVITGLIITLISNIFNIEWR